MENQEAQQQSQQTQQPQQPPQPQQHMLQPPVNVSDWFLTLFLTAIPLVGLILLFVWAFGSNTNPSKANWAKAALLWAAIGIVIWLLFMAVFGAAMFHSWNN
jgi:heme/copper-type cytochrome/quinol oxidase subunit 2